MNYFVTTYQRDYVEKKAKTCEPATFPQEFVDPITEGFKSYLRLDEEAYGLPEENAETFREKVKSKGQKVGDRYFSSPINHELVDEINKKSKKSVYVTDIAYHSDLFKDPLIRFGLTVPKVTDIQETTHRRSYRRPTFFQPDILPQNPVEPPIDNLGPREATAKIMNITTGKSEYQGYIGALGQVIIEKKLHGNCCHT